MDPLKPTLRSFRIRLDSEARASLKETLFGERAPCQSSGLRNRLRDLRENWWLDYGSKPPRWGLDVYALNEDGTREHLFPLYQLSLREARKATRLLERSTDRPLEIESYYWWA